MPSRHTARHTGLLIHLILVVALIAAGLAFSTRFAPWELTLGNLVLRSQNGMRHTFTPPESSWFRTASRHQGLRVDDQVRPRNVVLVIGDGMGIGQISSASALLRGPRGGMAVEAAPVTGLVVTLAGNDLVTDSAAASTAMATGYKAPKKAISVLADGSVPVTLMEAAKQHGMAVGVVTTSGLPDATPGAFVAHTDDRDDYAEILDDMLGAGLDVLIGGDWQRKSKALRNAEYQLMMSEIEVRGESAGYTVLRSVDRLADIEGHVLAVLPSRNGSPDAHGPPLDVTATLALDHLAATGRGFVLLVESEVGDGMGHENDIAGVVEGVAELDTTVAAVLAWAGPRGDTLVVVTADHDTGSPAIVDGSYDTSAAEIRWATDLHTSEWVPLFAFGPGAVAFSGVIDNTDIAVITAKLLGFEDFPRLHP